jgi:Glycosyl-4,4'-diaponeurosporenoate acyltransferase
MYWVEYCTRLFCNFKVLFKTDDNIKTKENIKMAYVVYILSFSVSIMFFSFIVGVAGNTLLKKAKFYSNELSNLNFIKSHTLNKWLGVDIVRWAVINTPFKYFSQHLKLKNKIEKSDLHKLRNGMTDSEIGHLIGFLFVFVMIFVLVKFYNTKWTDGLVIMIVNILMNLNPLLLQQQNKRRIDKLIKKM